MSIPSFIILSYYLSDLILKIVYKKGQPKRELNKNFQYILFIGLIPSVFVFRYFENTIGGYNLFWKLVFLSLIFNSLIVLILRRYLNSNDGSKSNNIFCICLCTFMLIPSVGIFINTNISNEIEKQETNIINYKKISKSSKGVQNYELFIKTEYDNNERLEVQKQLYEAIKDDNEIVLTLRKGILDYDYITKFDVK
ncbi:hypothetical protein RT99_16070 [Flavobacterium sp. MEB061]|nr:hypothetical protein RT99_16070 [Flavobacterium sp. MEB061]